MPHPAPANPRATPEARALLQFLQSLDGQQVLTGQHEFISSGNRHAEAVHALTGRHPAVWGSDFSFAYRGDRPGKIQHCGPLNLTEPGTPAAFTEATPASARANLVQRALARHAEGHLITLMWHHPFPPLGDSGDVESVWAMENRPGPAAWEELTTPGTALHQAWRAQAESLVPYLRALGEARVPILWRPYHEMNGVWFWWCNQPGPKGFARLWNQLFDLYVHEHHLDHLLWVWNTNAPRDRPGDEAHPYPLFYPGPERVDVLAADVYHRDYRRSHHDQLLELAEGRPIALGEVGHLPTPEILREQPRWAWFMAWGNLLTRWNEPAAIRALYLDERCRSRDDPPRPIPTGCHPCRGG